MTRPDSGVVVGVADSPGSGWALAAAVGAARRYRVPLTVVVAFVAHPPGRYRWALIADPPTIAQALTRDLFAEVCGGMPTDVPVRVVHVTGAPGPALIATAGAGDLLVVGHEGGRPWHGRTRRYCARHSRCPVLIVPRPDVGELLGRPVETVDRPAPRPRR